MQDLAVELTAGTKRLLAESDPNALLKTARGIKEDPGLQDLDVRMLLSTPDAARRTINRVLGEFIVTRDEQGRLELAGSAIEIIARLAIAQNPNAASGSDSLPA